MKMTFRGTENIAVENIQTPQSEIWYQDLKDVLSIELPERALVAAGMSLHWKMDREDKPVYMEDDKNVSLYVVAYKRDKGKMTTVPKGAGEELWYLRIVKNFVLPQDEDLAAQPPTGAGKFINFFSNIAILLFAVFAHGVSDTLEGLAPVVVRKPKVEPRDTADIPALNPDDPIDLESSPEPLLRTKAVKRKQIKVEAGAQPAKKVPKKENCSGGNLDAFITKPPPEKPIPSVRVEPSSVFNDDLPPSSPRTSVKEQLEDTKAVETEVEKVVELENPKEVEKPIEVELEVEKVMETDAADVDVTQPKSPEVVMREPEKGKSIHEDPMITIPTSAATSAPVNVERSPVGDHGFFAHDEEDSPIRLKETSGDYSYRSYLEKKASEIHAPVWKLKKGNTFSNWQVCRAWLQGTFPHGEVKFQEERSHDQSYHVYLEEAASFTSTTHYIVREWRSMHKEWAAFEASKKKVSEEEARVALLRAKLEADRAKLSVQKTKEWFATGWRTKAEAETALLSEERKRWREICGKDNNEKMGLRNVINNLKTEIDKLKKQDMEIERLKKEKAEAEAARDEARSHRERSEQREVQTCATLALMNKEIDELTSLLSDQEQIKEELEFAKKKICSLSELKKLRPPAA
ncbi:hypothetical protein HanPSC8_Chr11g0486301 [Helianthus annuus]|nr:hypothetical protein HanPSC8_Chr11g0486301 [Helianthus annuus]